MSVNQVEEYYIYMSVATANEEKITEINSRLDKEGLSDYEYQGDCILINGFYSEQEAADFERDVYSMLCK